MDWKKQYFFTLCHHIFVNPFLFLFLITLPLSPSLPQLQPRHHNIDNFLQHPIVGNIFLWNKICQNSLTSKPSPTCSYQLRKINLHFQNKEQSLMKPDKFEFKSLPVFPQKLCTLHHLITSHMLLNRKTQKTVSFWRSSRWNKAERNITHLNLS